MTIHSILMLLPAIQFAIVVVATAAVCYLMVSCITARLSGKKCS